MNRVEHAPAERWQHGSARAVTKDGREEVAKPVQSLLRAKRIGDAEVQAAERFYRSYSFGLEGVRSEVHEGPSGSSSPDAAMVARVDAMGDYSGAIRALGLAVATMLHAVVIEERSIHALAEYRAGRPFCRVQDAAAAALKALADHYAHRDSSGRSDKNG